MSGRLPWSWLALAAIVPAAGLASLAALLMRLSVSFGQKADLSTLLGMLTPKAGAFFILATGAATAFWLLLPLFAARATPYPAGAFLGFAPVISLARGIFAKADVVAKTTHQPLFENLPSLIGGVRGDDWFELWTISAAHLVGAGTYLIVARTVKRSS